MPYQVGYTERETQHKHCIEHADINAQFQGISGNDAEQLARKRLSLNIAPVLLSVSCLSTIRTRACCEETMICAIPPR